MAITGGGLSQGIPRGIWGYMGEGPGATKGSKQKALKPKMMGGKHPTLQDQIKINKRILPIKPFMPEILVQVPGKKK